MDIPGVGPLLINKPETDWMYQTVPQRDCCLALHNQVCQSYDIEIGFNFRKKLKAF